MRWTVEERDGHDLQPLLLHLARMIVPICQPSDDDDGSLRKTLMRVRHIPTVNAAALI